MKEHRVKVDNGKYVFASCFDGISILRHGNPWVQDITARNAIGSMMAELDAARLVIAAARVFVDEGGSRDGLVDALLRHDGLVDDREPPSEWTK